jgi:hypothetical protein
MPKPTSEETPTTSGALAAAEREAQRIPAAESAAVAEGARAAREDAADRARRVTEGAREVAAGVERGARAGRP